MKKSICILLTIISCNVLSARIYQPGPDSIPCPEFLANAGPDQVICAGESAVIGLNHGGLADTVGYAYLWSPAEGLDNAQIANPNADPTQTTTYILAVSQIGNSCVAYDTVLVTVKQPAYLMSFPPGPHYICAGQQVTLTGAWGFSSYRWEGPTGDLEGRIVQAGTAGIYRLNAIDAQGCQVKADSFELHVNTPLPLPTNPSGIKKICTGQTAQFVAAQGFIAYNWHTPTGTTGGRFITASVPGNYYVTATDANSCLSTSAMVTLEVNTPAIIAVQPNESNRLCPGASVLLNAPDGFSNYFWIGPLGQIPGKSILASQPGEYQLKAFDQNACLSASEPIQLITVQPAPIEIRFEGASSICKDATKQLSATAGFSQYSWSLPVGSDSGMSILANKSGHYQVSARDSNHCLSHSSELNLSTFPYAAIRLNLSSDTSICQGDTLQLIPEVGLAAYRWNTPQGISEVEQIQTTNPGAYQVTAIDSNGCRRISAVFNMQHLPLIRPFILSDGRDTLCPGDSRILKSSPKFTALQWNTPAGSTENEFIETNVGGIYVLMARDSNGCRVSSLPLFIHESFPFTPQIHVNSPLKLCDGEVILLMADSGYTAYQWSDGTTEQHKEVLTSAQLSLEVINPMGCVGTSDILELNFSGKPQAAFSYEQESNHQGIQFFNLSESAESWIWDFGDGNSSQEQHPEHQYSSRGSWSVSLVVGNACGNDTVFRELKMDPTAGLHEQEKTNSKIRMYPNPGSDQLFIDGAGLPSQGSRIIVQSLTGQVLFSETLYPNESGTLELNTQHLGSGVYLVITDQNQLRHYQRWVKR